ncbi:hypothetical protein F511_33110 [Dorcoceras hygrometricum]|uniref:Protein kinase domain-containing protein n=1 Tax=Dorcoceras hygrometricum TaxID=472368 RepID=A0A2Z7B867_9LAMI|nr:hypothetical protein F511_33110 [Dorcoceras hygrometricum]
MNHYHIYEAIGRGKYSTVYKGRKKKTIEYFAIKSVDKSHRTKVLQEVRILHTLDHSNVLKFYSWYETSAHLWLVLEYCVGGDLMTLLQQDGKLPEDSIKDLAHDLVLALQYLHSKGIIYCDLKPSNILLDENGHTKLCDFGLARKLSDISLTPASQIPQAKRGTPCYMAPELFQDGGVHSYASDFWALGCVLYECYTGRPPFVGNEFTQLAKSILLDATPALPGTPTRAFENLINSLLTKDPAERMQWPELCSHAFWRTKFSPLALPPQPAFANMIEVSSETHLRERNGDKPIRNKTPTKTCGKNSRGTSRQDENLNLRAKGDETPVKGVASNRKTHTNPSSRTADGKHKNLSNNTGGLNLLRLSRIAKSNLQRENEKENYRRPLPSSSKNDAEVKIENNDMELDFNENNEDEGPDELEGSESTSGTVDDNLSAPSKHEGKPEELDNLSSQSDTSNVVDNLLSEDSKTQEQELSSEQIEVSHVEATPPSANTQRKASRIKDVSGNALDFDATKSSTDLSEAFWHPSDLSVRPVMPSRKLDKGADAILSLPFDVFPASEFTKMPKEKLDSLCNGIVGILNGNAALGEKQDVIRYLEGLSSNVDAANFLTNGPIMLVLVKMLRQSKALALRVQLSSLIGLLIRHSTFIGDDLSNSGILGALTDGLRDRQEKVRRFSMAALGELLFYISTLSDHAADNKPQESPSKENRPTSGWQVPNSLISLIASVLRKGEDDLTQLYALRTVENISSHGGYWAIRFTRQDIISNLCYIFRAPGKQENMKLTAGSCLVRLVRFSPSSMQQVLEKLPIKDIILSLSKGNQREQQISLNVLNMAMLSNYLGRDDFQITLLRVLESVTEEPSALDNYPIIFLRQVLPSLTAIYKGNRDGDARFLCLKIFFDVMVLILNDDASEDKRWSHDLKSISNDYFLPLYPSLIVDEDPIPMYAQKLLVMLIESNHIKISDILHMKAVSQCFDFLLGDFSTITVSNVMLCLALASAPELEIRVLSQLKVVRKIGNFLEFVHAKEMEDLIGPTLSLCRAFLLRSVSSKKAFVYSREPTLLSDNSRENATDQQQCIKDIMDFGGNVGVLLELSKSSEANISDLASECITLLFQAAPREATMNLMMNLSKVSMLLDSRSNDIAQLVVERTLHSLGFAIRLYLTHSMILSVGTSELAKIEALVSQFRSSGLHTIADAAFQVALELQRIPH